MTYDTLKFVETLTAAGVPEVQAKAHLVANMGLQHDRSELATKGDVLALKADIVDLKHELRELESRMTIKLGGMMVATIFAAAGLFAWLVKYLPGAA